MALFEPIHSIQEQAKDVGLALIAESPTIKKDIEDNLAATNNAVKTTINSMRLDIANTASDIIEGVENKIGEGIGNWANTIRNDAVAIKEDASKVGQDIGNIGADISRSASNAKNLVTGNIDQIQWKESTVTSKASTPKKTLLQGSYLVPGLGTTFQKGEKKDPDQASPLLNTYSPRLFGSPPQLTSLNDMRLLSADTGENRPGPVGDFYLTKILQDAQVANFVVGHALFTGGMQTAFGIISLMFKYATALKRYNIFGTDTLGNTAAQTDALIKQSDYERAYKAALENDDGTTKYTVSDKIRDIDDETAILDINSIGEAKTMIETIEQAAESAGGSNTSAGSVNSSKNSNGTLGVLAGIGSALLTSLSVQQPFYTFESDWHSYIENVKMMINTAVIMLGLQDACIRVGDELIPLSMGQHYGKNEPWALYSRWITYKDNLGSITGFDKLNGDTSQYVSFMVDPAGSTETYTNEVGDSQIYASVINQGADIGSEIAFITNASKNSIDDAIVNIAGGAISAAESVLSAMTGGVGRFTAAIAGSFARTFVGNHTIYPQIFKSHTSTTTRDIVVHLNASGGDPYSYLMEVLVPYFHILGLVLPQLSKNNASSYSFPPLVQVNIPGVWGTRLGMVTSVSVNKNQSGKDLSIHGFPLSIDVTMTVTDLQHVLMTSPQDRASTFLNNHTMFDYIAVCAGVDKYRPNGAMRLVARLALMANTINNIDSVVGNALLTDFTSIANRITNNVQM